MFVDDAEIQLAAATDTFAPWKFSNPWFGTVRGRAGYAVSNVLLYGTAGLAFGELSGETFGLVSENHTNLGWTAGVGAEVPFTPGRTDASQEQTDVESCAPREPAPARVRN